MIAIVNVGPFNGQNPLGEFNYELRINSEVIATFKHNRSDGLAKCLMKAAAAEELRFDTKKPLQPLSKSVS